MRGSAGIPGSPGSPGMKGFPGDPGRDGSQGRQGNRGYAGSPGTPGSPGVAGEAGNLGNPGNPGFSGSPGASGARGSPGTAGVRGENGLPGRDGSPGRDGRAGGAGYRGNAGLAGTPGSPGRRGPPGPAGSPGRDGTTTTGPAGYAGNPGTRGNSGAPGLQGGPGAPGDEGLCGNPGPQGGWVGGTGPGLGRPGPRGSPGRPGATFKSRYVQPMQYTIHSQTNELPVCPDAADIVGQGYSGAAFAYPDLKRFGYSAFYMDTSSGSGFGQPLSSTGSCLVSFEIQPIVECTSQQCEVIGDDSSIWMSTHKPDSDTRTLMEFFPSGEIEYTKSNPTPVTNYISRCQVCESQYPWMAVHSFTNDIPNCPKNMYGTGVRFNSYVLWEGYSIVMARDRGGGVGQDLASPGSCLKYFSPIMTVKCVPSGTIGRPNCHFQSPDAKAVFIRNSAATWSDRIGPVKQGQQTMSQDWYISRCSVCLLEVQM